MATASRLTDRLWRIQTDRCILPQEASPCVFENASEGENALTGRRVTPETLGQPLMTFLERVFGSQPIVRVRLAWQYLDVWLPSPSSAGTDPPRTILTITELVDAL